jgi:hypothetical protein
VTQESDNVSNAAPVPEPERDGELIPTEVRWIVFGIVTPLILGSLYLVAVRGHALFLDLKQSPASFWCF